MRILALMSGSSLDGLDIGVIELGKGSGWKIIQPKTVEYSKVWLYKLKNSTNLNGKDLMILDAEYAKLIANYCKSYLLEHNTNVDLVSVHGHTVFHEVENKVSYQLGNGGVIASELGIPVVCDFRTTDMSKGGQGAPLMAIVDKLFFTDYLANINLGGIANISAYNDNNYAAFDIAPCNQVLNYIANKEGFLMDENAILSGKGSFQSEIMNVFLKDSYLEEPYPKSLSNENVTLNYINKLESLSFSSADKAYTFISFVVDQIIANLKLLQKNNVLSINKKRILVSGGGAFHPLLMKKLKDALYDIEMELTIPDSEIINYKELLLMGVMAFLRYNKMKNILHEFTGAVTDSLAGAIYEG